MWWGSKLVHVQNPLDSPISFKDLTWEMKTKKNDFIDPQGYEESNGMQRSISKKMVGENEIKQLFMPITISLQLNFFEKMVPIT